MDFNFTSKEIIIYAVIAIVIIVGIVVVFSGTLNTGPISVNVRIQQLNASQTLYPYQASQFQVYVNNTGGSSISDLVLATYVDDQQLQTYTLNLPAHTGLVVNGSYIYPTNGTYQIEAIADPGHLLDVQNRNTTSSAFISTVVPPQVPNIYSSVPNGNINASQHFTLVPNGTVWSIYISENYNAPQFNQMTNYNNPEVVGIYRDLVASGLLYNIAGAYTSYTNGTTSYVSWLEGTANLSDIGVVLSSFGKTPVTTNINGNNVMHVALTNSTSLCAFYSTGWTKIVEFTNSSTDKNQNCISIVSNTYNSTEATKQSTLLAADQDLEFYQSNFVYVNSTPTGFSIFDYNGSLAAMDLYQNHYGIFGAYVQRNVPPLSFNGPNMTCYGLVTNIIKNLSVCSIKVLQTTNITSNYSLVNSIELTKNYTLNLYSLVETSFEPNAHQSAVDLIGYLNVTGPREIWVSNTKSSCGFAGNITTTPTCSVLSYNYTNNTVVINVNNTTSKPIQVNSAACYIAGFSVNQTMSVLISAGHVGSLDLNCSGSIPGSYTSYLQYDLLLNYTSGGSPKILGGSFIVPNYGLGG
jgi:hypothetical protein